MTLKDNIGEVNSSFVAIKNKIEECGVDVADNTYIRDYAGKVSEVFNKGREQGRNNPIEPTNPTVTDERTSLAYWYQSKVGLVKNYVEADNEEGYSKIRPTPIESLIFPTGTQNIQSFSNFADVFVEGYSGLEKEKIWTKKFTGTLDVANATSMASCFIGIPELEEIGQIANSEKVINFSYMFTDCIALKIIPNFDTSKGTNFENMFAGCESLINAPVLDTSSGKYFKNMFKNCYNMIEAPALDISKGINLTSIFEGCTALVSAPQMDTSNVQRLNYIFHKCSGLVNTQPYDTSNAVNLAGMYAGCSSLIFVPFIDASNSGTLDYIFTGCHKLQNIEGIKVEKDTTTLNNAFNACNKLERCIFSGTIYKGIDMKWSKLLDKESITSVINALSTETNGISATISKTAVNNAFETSVGAKDGNSSPEWLALVATKPNWTISLVDA